MPVPLHGQFIVAGQRTLACALKLREVVSERLPIRATQISQQALSDIVDRSGTLANQLINTQGVLSDLRKRHVADVRRPTYVPGEEEACPICLEGPPSHPLNWKGVCNHAFHGDCIYEYFESCAVKAECPVCRLSLEADDFAAGGSVNDINSMFAYWHVCLQHLLRLQEALLFCYEWSDDVQCSISKLFRLLEDVESGEEVEATLELHQAVNSDAAKDFELACRAACKDFAMYRALRGGLTEQEADVFVKAQLGFE